MTVRAFLSPVTKAAFLAGLFAGTAAATLTPLLAETTGGQDFYWEH